MPNVPRIVGIAEIVLSVRDLPTMKSFYTKTLGFEFESESSHVHSEKADPNGEPTIVFLKISDVDSALGRNGHPQLLALIDYQRHFFARERLTGHNVKSSTLNHLAFEITEESYHSYLNYLQQLGLEPRETVFDQMQAKSLFFKDPEGNLLELICHWPIEANA